MGHAGAWTGIAEGTAESKYKALESVGVTMVDHPAKFGGVMKDLLAKSGRDFKKIVSTPFSALVDLSNIRYRNNPQPNNAAHITPTAVRHRSNKLNSNSKNDPSTSPLLNQLSS